MVNELIVEVITYAVTSIVSLLIGVLISERFKKWWRRRERLHDLLEPKIKFRVTHISDPEAPAIDFSPKLKEQNRQQNTFLFEFEDFMRGPTLEDVSELKRTNSKRNFVDKIGRILACARGGVWKGLTDKSPYKRFKGRRDLVLTNIPLPDNYYGWNSKDRTILVISIAPILHFFSGEGKPTVDDFIVRMAQRMVIFSAVPSIDPKQAHVQTSVGCLFDFTVELRRVVDVVRTPYICPDCLSQILRDRGQDFTVRVLKWLGIDLDKA